MFKWKMCFVYFDDVTMFSDSIEEHHQHVDDILNILTGAYVLMTLSKSYIFCTIVTYLDHFVKLGKLEIEACEINR